MADFVEIISEKQFNVIKSVNPELEKILRTMNILVSQSNKLNFNGGASASPSTNNAATASNNATISQNNKLLSEQQRLTVRLNQLKREESIEIAKLRVEISNLTKEQKKQAQEALGLFNSYQKLDAELGSLRLEAKGLAADMFLLEQAGQQNSEEYQRLAATYSQVANRVNLLDGGLKKIDGNLGQYQRNVGNYASGFNPLNNAIGQISRELPNLGQSFEIFALSIGNNIGAVKDAIDGLIAQNRELISQGQPTVNIFKRIASSVLSWNTALFIGIAGFIAYSKEISTFVQNLFRAQKALDAVKRSQEILNAVGKKAQQDIVDEITTYKLYLETARDVNKSDAERAIAVNKLQQEYAFYFGQLSKGQILAGETAKAEAELNKALEARENTLGISKEYNENQVNLVKIRQNLTKTTQDINKEERLQASLREAGRKGTLGAFQVTAQLLESYDRQNKAIGIVNTLTKSQNYYQDINNKLIEKAIANKKVAIGLEYQEEEAKKKNIERSVDFQASEYELIRTRLENEASLNERILNNEEINYDKRKVAADKYNDILSELAQRRLAEELRVIERSKNEEIESITQRIKEQEITEKSGRRAIYALQKQAQFDSLKAYEDYYEDLRQVNISIEESLKGVWNEINFAKADSLIDTRDLENAKKYNNLLESFGKNTDYRQIQKAEKQFAESDRSITKARIQAQIDYLQVERLAIKEKGNNVQRILELDSQISEQEKALTDVIIKENNERLAAFEKLQKATESYLETFKNDKFSQLGLSSFLTFFDKDENGNSPFQNLLDGADSLEEKFAVVFTSITEIAQETLNFLNQNSQAYFDQRYANLEKEKELAIENSAQTEAAKAAIERQYDEKRRQIRRQELQQQKEAAIFNATIDTAQAVVAALPNYALAAVVAALGAAQIALISSQPIPAYKHGTDNHKGGMALVGDGGKHEVVWQPTAGWSITPNKDTLVNLEKGSKVFPDIASSGIFNNGMPDMIALNGNGITANQMDKIMRKHGRVKQPAPQVHIHSHNMDNIMNVARGNTRVN